MDGYLSLGLTDDVCHNTRQMQHKNIFSVFLIPLFFAGIRTGFGNRQKLFLHSVRKGPPFSG